MTHDGRVDRGIYKLSDDTLTLCLAGTREARPVDFNGDGVGTVFILKRTKVPAGTATGVSGGESDKRPVTDPPVAFTNATGWSWHEVPQPRTELGTSGGRSNIFTGGYSYILEESKDGALLVYLAFATSKSIFDYRPVAFDAERKRYLFKPNGGGGAD